MKSVLCLFFTLLTAYGSYAQSEALQIGQVAPEISLPTPEGDTVTLSSLRGKLVLVDFWATWCAPCVEEQPELHALYKKYNGGTGNGRFEILGVSLDRSRVNWVEGIERFNIDWIQVSDLLFWRSPVANDYAIQGLPFNVLVDERGTIVASDLHGAELAEFIADYLNRI